MSVRVDESFSCTSDWLACPWLDNNDNNTMCSTNRVLTGGENQSQQNMCFGPWKIWRLVSTEFLKQVPCNTRCGKWNLILY